MSEKILIGVEMTALYDEPDYKKGSKIITHVKLTHLDGNKDPYWSFTAEVYEKGRREASACGAMTEAIAKSFPDLAPFVGLHLADDSGMPMHAAENGWHFMGEGKHSDGFNVDVLARHLRITPEEAQRIRDEIKPGDKSGFVAAVVGEMSERWKRDSDALKGWLKQAPGVYGTLVGKLAPEQYDPMQAFVERNGITIECHSVKDNPFMLSENKPKQPWLAPNHWQVNLANKDGGHFQTFYTMGPAHIERRANGDPKWVRDTRQFNNRPSIDEARGYMHEPTSGSGIKRTRPAVPNAGEVLQAIASDIQSVDNSRSFDDWYSELCDGQSPTKAKHAYDEIEYQREQLKSFLGRAAYNELVNEEVPDEAAEEDSSPVRPRP